MKISKVIGREIIDSRGHPTVEAEVHTKGGYIGIASVPSGASVGSKEAVEIRDNDKNRFFGKGVLTSVRIINDIISKELMNKEVCDQNGIDEIMIQLDNSSNKSKLGSNTILSVSLAAAKAAAYYKNMRLYEYISYLNGSFEEYVIPLPMFNIINGGLHADNNIDIQEFMIVPIGANNIKQAVQWGSEVFFNLSKILKSYGMNISVGDEGGYAPDIPSVFFSLSIIKEAINNSGYILGKDIYIAIDCAASNLFNSDDGLYYLRKEKKKFFSNEFTHYLQNLVKEFSIISIEDGMHEDDWDGFCYHTKILGNDVQLVGDDLFVTNEHLLRKGIKAKAANAILIKLNQIGTLTETIKVINLAKKNGYSVIISHRSGETEDCSIADLAVGTSAGQIKAGSLCRSERVAKYNRLIRIEEFLKNKAFFYNFFKRK